MQRHCSNSKTVRVAVLACALSLFAVPVMADDDGDAAPAHGHLVASAGAASASGASPAASAGTSVRPDRLRHVHRVVIDPGHGGRNEGAVGVGAMHEKHLTLPISLYIADRLRAAHPELEVVLTRQSDREIGLTERAEIANAHDADLFLSIHLNAAVNREALGYETYTVRDATPIIPDDGSILRSFPGILPDLVALAAVRKRAATEARHFAEHLHAAYASHLDGPDRGIKEGNYTVLRKANVPAVVIELGFLSHAQEGIRLLDPAHQRVLVDALIEGIEDYDAAKAWSSDDSGEVVAASR